ncbi:MAG: amidohydrolase family protein [Alphaproteobacteria bacterium]|nr:amidohydrolase family protein [Alphaproteobacteria bacterium]
MRDVLISNVRLPDGKAAAIEIRGGRIAAIHGVGASAAGVEAIDGGNALVLPGLVEAHTHLDKTLLGMPWYRNDVGPRLIDKIDNERLQKKKLGIDPQRQSSRQVVLSVSKGSTHIRSHVDVDTEGGLSAIEGVLATRERYRDICDLQIVAFPQSGLLVRKGTLELMEAAMRAGADVVGGLDPCAIDRDPRAHVDAVFALAQKSGKGVDIHLHEPGELGGFSMELIIERTRALGMQGKVVVSHAFCLGMPEAGYVAQLVDQLAETRIAIMTHGAPYRPVPNVKQLQAAGVTVCCGSDGIRDTWGPYGNADMLERAMIVGLRNNLRRDDEVELALDIVTHGGAKAMELEGYGLRPGAWGDLVLVDVETPAEAVAARPPRKLVLKRGRVVARDGKALVEAP